VILAPSADCQRAHAVDPAFQTNPRESIQADFGRLPNAHEFALRLVDDAFDLHAGGVDNFHERLAGVDLVSLLYLSHIPAAPDGLHHGEAAQRCVDGKTSDVHGM